MNRIKYWKDIDVLDIGVKEGEYEYSEEVAEGVILDIDKDGEILSIEIHNVTRKMNPALAEKLSSKYEVAEA
jgi:uncharacterized protein YuzE